MTIRADCIQRPANPLPRSFIPEGGVRYKVQDGDSWIGLAQKFGAASNASFDPWFLIRFNYPGLAIDPRRACREVNWYLREYVGCRILTLDKTNYVFSASATPGIIYQPQPAAYAASAPVLVNIADRRNSIMANTPATFIVSDNPTATAYKEAFYSVKRFEEVTENNQQIETAAAHLGLDPDFLRAIVWMETTHGYYDRVYPWNKTLRPMNVHFKLWSDLGLSKSTLKTRSINIAAGAHILAAIWERTKDPTPEKVATLFNALGETTVNVYGRTVVHYMNFKPWLHR